MATNVHDDNCVVSGQSLDLAVPHFRVAKEAMEQEQGLSLSMTFEVYFVPVDCVGWHSRLPFKGSLTGMDGLAKWVFRIPKLFHH